MALPKTVRKRAFVAMQFQSDSWNDQRYLIISEVLREAGYEPIRADQIQSSGGIVDEVCAYLEKSPLVVIDSTGNSQSVSYEIGYCHGVKRNPAKTLLIRQGDGKDIPFNYRHFRHQCYKDFRHLRRLLRERLSLSTPLTDDQFGYVLTFPITTGAHEYAPKVQEAILETIGYFDFTGRCELYDADGRLGNNHFYWAGVGLKFQRIKNPTPDYKWWMKFCQRIKAEVESRCQLTLDEMLSEIGGMRGIRRQQKNCGVYEFIQGKQLRFLEPDPVLEEACLQEWLSRDPFLQADLME